MSHKNRCVIESCLTDSEYSSECKSSIFEKTPSTSSCYYTNDSCEDSASQCTNGCTECQIVSSEICSIRSELSSIRSELTSSCTNTSESINTSDNNYNNHCLDEKIKNYIDYQFNEHMENILCLLDEKLKHLENKINQTKKLLVC